jgi:hypothetical protein
VELREESEISACTVENFGEDVDWVSVFRSSRVRFFGRLFGTGSGKR